MPFGCALSLCAFSACLPVGLSESWAYANVPHITGPGSSEFHKYEAYIPLDLRLLACQCLSAIVGTRDSSTASVMGRFSWLQHDLGVNRGQYMGLLPCMLRSCLAYLTSSTAGASLTAPSSYGTPPVLSEQERAGGTEGSLQPRSSLSLAPDSHTATLGSIQTSEQNDRLVWTEHILALTMALINVSNTLPALIENGFIALLLSVVRTEPTASRSTLRTYTQGLAIQLLEMSLGEHPLVVTAFKEMCGAEALLERLMKELTLLSAMSESDKTTESTADSPLSIGTSRRKRRRVDTNAAVAAPTSTESSRLPELRISSRACTGSTRVLIHILVSSFSVYLQEAGDFRQTQLLRAPLFSSVCYVLFQSSAVMSSAIMAQSFGMLGEVINNDPSIVSHMLSSGLAAAAIDVMIRDSQVVVLGPTVHAAFYEKCVVHLHG